MEETLLEQLTTSEFKAPADDEYVHVQLTDGTSQPDFYATKDHCAYKIIRDAMYLRGLDFQTIARQAAAAGSADPEFTGIESPDGWDEFTFAWGTFQVVAAGPFPFMNEEANRKRSRREGASATTSISSED